jgi:predicted dehydrogenase
MTAAAKPIGLGIIGCGGVTQIIHLPALAQLPDRFRVAALCDVSRATVDGVGERWNVPVRCLDHRELLARRDVDAVLIANPHAHHAEVAIAAMEAGKHVLIEKPMCLTLADADRLIAVAARTGVTAQVGYMRRYAPAFLEAKKLLSPAEIRHARVQDVIGQNALIVDSTSLLVRGDDLPAEAAARTQALQAEMIAAAIGPAPADLNTAYLLLLGLASHDVSAMRELIGTPRAVLFAARRWAGRWVAAALDYGSFVCELAIGVDTVARMDAHLEFFTGAKVVRVEYDTPYVRNLPTRLIVTEPNSGVGVTHSAAFPTRQDSFVIEWMAFHENITTGRAPKTSLADSREDLVLFAQMIEKMRA